VPSITPLHLDHIRELFFAERSRRELIRSSLSTPVAAISFAVFALSTLSVHVELDRWSQLPTLLIMVMSAGAAAALFASAYQVIMSEWLFTYHEPPRLPDLLNGGDSTDGPAAEDDDDRIRGLLAASYAVAYEQYLKGNAVSARRRTWALRLILLSLLLQAAAFVILPLHRAGW
jgi:hypothetical protein